MKVVCIASILALVASFETISVSAESSAFLKEILTGRCYDRPPSGKPRNIGAATCPSVVGSFMGALEGRSDSQITSTDFDMYMKGSDFSSPEDHALFWLRFLGAIDDPGSKKNQDSFIWEMRGEPPTGLVTPETTPGGALMKDLVFCGSDRGHGNQCKAEESNAYWIFWESAYATFAKQVTGHVQVVVEPLADATFLDRSALAYLDPKKVTGATIYAVDCTSSNTSASKLVASFQQQGISDVNCKEDLVEFVLCQGDNPSNECGRYRGTGSGPVPPPPPPGGVVPPPLTPDGQVPPPPPDGPVPPPPLPAKSDDSESGKGHGHKAHHFFRTLFWLVVIAFILKYLYKEYQKGTFHYAGKHETVQDRINEFNGMSNGYTDVGDNNGNSAQTLPTTYHDNTYQNGSGEKLSPQVQ